jgi:hypothetical protein
MDATPWGPVCTRLGGSMHSLTNDKGLGTTTLVIALSLLGCADERAGEAVDGPGLGTALSGDDADASTSTDTGDPDDGADAQGTSGASGNDGTASGDGANPPVKFDFGIPDAPEGSVCGAPSPVTCDHMSNDPWNAMGLNCPGGPQVNGSIQTTNPAQVYVHEGNLGTYVDPVDGPPFPPREGVKMVFLSSGNAAQLLTPMAGNQPSTAYNGSAVTLPAPIQTNNVSATEDCIDNPGLVGTGDCSNTIQTQYNQGGGPRDYAELRFNVQVPAGTFGFSYEFAFFSVEYPQYYGSIFNDMYIAWLESEQWTGNISFDEFGAPISLNAGFLDYTQSVELQGTGAQGHAGTRWLSTQAPVTPGETIEVIFAIFDLSDAILDSMIILDNFEWNCEGGPPLTIPG